MISRMLSTNGLLFEGIKGENSDERYVLQKCAIYIYRHMERFPVLDHATIQFILWTMGLDLTRILEMMSSLPLPDDQQSELRSAMTEYHTDLSGYSYYICNMLRQLKPHQMDRFNSNLNRLIDERIRKLAGKNRSDLKKNIRRLVKMFSLTRPEEEFLTFLYIVSNYEHARSFFESHLECNKLSGQRFIINALNMSKKEFKDVINGKLATIESFEFNNHSFGLTEDFILILRNGFISSSYFVKLSRSSIPLEYHFINPIEIRHILNLLSTKPDAPVHILFYGDPGTGKSTCAKGICEKANVPAYEISKGNEQNASNNRRAAILACLNMTNTVGDGSIVVVDEADNLLNTVGSWLSQGETKDKGWLNHILEQRGVRMIWITNSIHSIEDSVLRRFTFSLRFKSFNRRQRVQLWDNIVIRNKVKGYLDAKDREMFARKYRVNAGAIDTAINKIALIKPKSKKEFHDLLGVMLTSHQTLMNYGEKKKQKDPIDQSYSTDGLNITGDVEFLLQQCDRFNEFLIRSDEDERKNFNLIFYGTPGSGKSEFARYICERLGREVICKRASDLQNMFVGATEKNIKNAFEQAETEEAILIIDEVDTFLFSRESAIRSWEISQVNEFLTQMERFRGMLICTTNRLKGLDEASIRRFNHKIEFDFLTAQGTVIFYHKMLAPMISATLEQTAISRLLTLHNLTPGDFKIVRDRFAFYTKDTLTHDLFIDALVGESKLKSYQSGERMIGF